MTTKKITYLKREKDELKAFVGLFVEHSPKDFKKTQSFFKFKY